MTIELTTLPRRTRYTMRPVKGANTLRPAFGGPRQPFNRMGDHWALDIEPGPMSMACGLELASDLVRAAGETVRVRIPNVGDRGAPGTPLVAGADQSGSSLDCDGFTPYFPIRKGWLFSVVSGGRRYVHMVTAETVADAVGAADLPIWPMLRVSPEDNAVVEMAEPWIEGFVDDGGAFDTGLIQAAVPARFTIEERA